VYKIDKLELKMSKNRTCKQSNGRSNTFQPSKASF